MLPYDCRVIPLDEIERGRWRAHAADELRAAKHYAGGGFHHVAVLHAELAAQCALKALLRGVGRTEHARGHDLLRLAATAADHAPLALDDLLTQRLAALARDDQRAVTPMRCPGAGQAVTGPLTERAVDTAEQVLAAGDAGVDSIARRGEG